MLVHTTNMISLDNITDGEEVYQRCVLITGQCRVDTPSQASYLSITTLSDGDQTIFPEQQWPVHNGHFKALLILSPGNNKISLRPSSTASNDVGLTITLRYIPLLQTPPLYLAILIAKDSPLLIDCPPCKFPTLSTTHSSLSAAIAKFRMTALMWQALTAEEFRLNGLSRRSFRLEEEWSTDSTLSSTYLNDMHQQASPSSAGATSVPKIHLIRTEHTVSFLRDVQRAQQNPSAKEPNSLHEIFSAALKAHGVPFSGGGPATVAGLILDSHFDLSRDLILGHAALGAHDPAGLSLGIFGSHLTHAWPRFLEEVTACLTDSTVPGETVANDNGECATMWEACVVGQGAFLHEVGHAFGAPHSSGIMQRGYSPDWARWFVSRMGDSSRRGPGALDDRENCCRWDVRDLLRFKALAEFRLPADRKLDPCEPVVEMMETEEEESVRVVCEVGIAMIMLNAEVEPVTSVREPVREVELKVAHLESRFDRKSPLELVVVGMNGKEKKLDVWKFLSSRSWIRVPGTNIRLMKKAVGEPQSVDDCWEWAVMLKKRGRNGKLVDASKIDIRVGCALDGAVVYYRDGSTVPCGPWGARGYNSDADHGMGGHQARKMAIRSGVEVVKVAVNVNGSGWGGCLNGLRIWLSDGNARGALNGRSRDDQQNIRILVPDQGQRIIGFYGASGQYGMCHQFGIVTAPRDVELPDSVYDMEELQHKPESRRARKRRRVLREEEEHESDRSDTENDDSASTSEDEDDGYDNPSDVEDLE